MILLTILGTVCCIAMAFALDSYSFEDGRWRLGDTPLNNFVLPLIIAPPFFFYLLSKLRQLAIAHDLLMRVATTDGLTSCLTRVAFTTLVDAYLGSVTGEKERLDGALLVVDVDHFKRVNDRFGHDNGDEALRLIVSSMRSSLRDIDLIGRMGGEEFGVFLPGVPPPRAAMVAQRLRVAVTETSFVPDGFPYQLSVSVGVVTFMRRTTFSELYKIADVRLYDAKRSGRNRVEISHLEASSGPSPPH
ncbi:GGDEF domain-containing protein [Mesorhizobium sp. ES1-1]|uniref:GGDEF domain-containing protein n=1 Tax=Mesorhizobium sp. ES1-1 TaxID=2876629 RepID=UPI001CD00AEF|nr:GGDEF domain-containing protein [Mesorhizobium sp. ES1-1]MBZ9677921.1 GGDEF domain-containing protein [Mesorhizobium sp. ES1-1]